jgi:hypothetical protein
MRTTVIPAQITTIEDKIAGNLNLTQILILMVPLFWTTIVYALFAPSMHLALYKFPLVLIVTFVCIFLSFRVKGKVVIEWLAILSKFNLRPRFYVFDKNDDYLRNLDLPVFEKKPLKLFNKQKAIKIKKLTSFSPNLGEIVKLESFMRKRKYRLSFRTNGNGGINVACK